MTYKESYTIPNERYLKTAKDATPRYMFPDENPLAVVYEEAVHDDLCDKIIKTCMIEPVYPFNGCEAQTRECPRPLPEVLRFIVNSGVEVNDRWWQFNLHNTPGAWLQTYEMGDSYQPHVDGTVGQTRKLTVIVLLTDPDEYEGGDLRIYSGANVLETIPRTRGTMVVIPPWVLHDVTPLDQGIRQTLNLGFWGPPFR